eukprot:CAMPEP_0182874476 /NCGR_PEP_ID=MMETSP0034_2-20130328/12961_1 /TAXON_ID=156128 /ORGANISM="Nephroselmis pyriformis, Strain CCMP717" /LENGTH=317 /DNA_ID=CAMNT_0025007187 /DNA_START=158 /DNA_END=1108 /DNA_ORIENTATION=-
MGDKPAASAARNRWGTGAKKARLFSYASAALIQAAHAKAELDNLSAQAEKVLGTPRTSIVGRRSTSGVPQAAPLSEGSGSSLSEDSGGLSDFIEAAPPPLSAPARPVGPSTATPAPTSSSYWELRMQEFSRYGPREAQPLPENTLSYPEVSDMTIGQEYDRRGELKRTSGARVLRGRVTGLDSHPAAMPPRARPVETLFNVTDPGEVAARIAAEETSRRNVSMASRPASAKTRDTPRAPTLREKLHTALVEQERSRYIGSRARADSPNLSRSATPVPRVQVLLTAEEMAEASAPRPAPGPALERRDSTFTGDVGGPV